METRNWFSYAPDCGFLLRGGKNWELFLKYFSSLDHTLETVVGGKQHYKNESFF